MRLGESIAKSSYYNNYYCVFARTLHHPNILTFIGIIKERSRITILTNYVVGKNLYELLHDHDKKVCV